MDRDALSSTYGCADRQYWHYKVTDFANARAQEASLVLALAGILQTPGNVFFEAPQFQDWALAAIDFWCRKRHRDGSTDESYPFERHFCSTAFTLYAVTETLLLLKCRLPQGLSVTGDFLCRNDNVDVANQMACAAEALYNLFLLTGKFRYKEGYEDKVSRLLAMQGRTGAFNEYGGFDLGYDTITLSFLAGLFRKTGREDISAAARKACDNMADYIDEDGYFPPEGMSRQTQFLYPFGFSVFAPSILEKISCGLKKGVILNPSWMDDRYCIPFTVNYLLTARELQAR